MLDTLLVAIAVTAGLIALIGVPLRAWQFHSGRFRAEIPRHAVARATFSVFAVLFLVPNLAAWAYALYTAHLDFTCLDACEPVRARTAITIGMLGCAYMLLEGFLLTARRRIRSVPAAPGRSSRP
jgi:hypothetical protein